MSELKKEQLCAISHDTGDMLVSASAGSGKTFVVIQRILRLLSENKTPVTGILAVTFTESAAKDMKEKLKTALNNRAAEGDSFAEENVAEISAADVCTLHSFCAKILRLYFFKAGVSPDFAVIDESDADALKKECLDKAFKKFFDDKDQEFLFLVKRHLKNRKSEDLKSLVSYIHGVSQEEADPDLWLNKYETVLSPAGFDNALKEFGDFLQKDVSRFLTVCGDAVSVFGKENVIKGVEFCEEFSAALKTVAGKDAYSFLSLKNYGLKNSNFGGKDIGEEVKLAKKRVQEANSEFKKLLKDALSLFTDETSDKARFLGSYAHAKAIVKVVRAFGEEYAKAKEEENVLDFCDLQRFALAVLKDPEVLKEIRDRYKYVFVDEYQDINPLQEEILSLLGGGNAFMVGDEKQSIYGFRGCSPEYFSKKRESLEKTGNTVYLNYNFRSAKAVINAVNEIFDYCYTENLSGIDYKKTSRLIFGDVYPEGADGRVTFHVLKKTEKKKEPETPRIYDVLKETAKTKDKNGVATLIADIIINKETNDTYYDREEKTFKPVRFKDIALLSRSRETEYVKDIVKGLVRRGVPVKSDVSVNVCEYPEILTLIWFLRLLDCFYQDIPLINVMLSPLFGFTEEELFSAVTFSERQGKKINGFCDAFFYCLNCDAFPLKEQFAAFKESIDSFRTLADFKGAKGVLKDAIDGCGYENLLLCTDGGRQKLKRLYKFLSLAETGGKVLTVSEFLYKIDFCPKAFAVSLSGEEDAVSVMTIHSSKGLEFPVVIVCGLEKPFVKKDETPAVIVDREDGILPKFFDDEEKFCGETLARGLKKLKLRKKRVTEELRLFYVATTRAEYSLHLILEGEAKENPETFRFADRFSDFMPPDFPYSEYDPESFNIAEKTTDLRKILISCDAEDEERMRKTLSFTYPFAESVSLPLKASVTSTLKTSSVKEETEESPAAELFPVGVTDTERGVIAHRIMQYYDFNGDSFESQIEKMISGGVVSDKELSSVDVSRIKAAAVGVAEKIAGKTFLTEKEFTVNAPANIVFDVKTEENVLLQGVIDLIVIDEDKDEAEIVDYKYSVLSPDALKEKYAKQLFLYAFAVNKILNKKVTKTTLVNLYRGEISEVKTPV